MGLFLQQQGQGLEPMTRAPAHFCAYRNSIIRPPFPPDSLARLSRLPTVATGPGAQLPGLLRFGGRWKDHHAADNDR